MIYSVEDIKNRIKKNKDYLKENFYVNNLLLFGSYARGSQTEASDIDLLVEFSKNIDLLKMIDLQEYLSKLFGKRVDLGTLNGLKSYAKEAILNEAIVL